MKLGISLVLSLIASVANAQTQPAVSVDPTLFQTTGFFRLANSDFEIIPAQPRDFAMLDESTFKAILDPSGKPKIQKGQASVIDNHSTLPGILGSGSNYAVLVDQRGDRSMVTFSSTWDMPLPKGKIDFEVETYGGVYLIKKGTREIVTVSSSGYVNFSTTIIAPAIRLAGGNFFIDVNNDLWTVDYKGFVYHWDSVKYPQYNLKYPLASIAGGNYFYQTDGKLVTIPSDGNPQIFKDQKGNLNAGFVPNSKPVTFGGNYYIGQDGVIYSVAYNGVSYMNGKSLGQIKTLGYSYAIFDKGFIAVDGLGAVHVDAFRVGSVRSQYRRVLQINDAIDPKSVYTPNGPIQK